MKFQYVTVANSLTTTGKHKKRPVVEVVLTKNGKSREFLAVIDSGADITTMSTQIADVFGIDWKKCPQAQTLGISGITQISYLSTMDVSVKRIGETLSLPVLFTEAEIPLLLGQEGFFDNYRIKFEKDHDVFEITKSKRGLHH